jgi:hypothetical protein
LAGAVVEVVITADMWNDVIDGILAAHNQDGTHKSGLVLTLPQINDTSSDHQYILSVCELTADRTVALPLLTGNDEVVFKDHTQTLTNKTLTTPVLNGAFTGTATPPLTFYGTNFNAPEGFLINGKIVPSVATNDLTVAIKGMDGNDPSATNPVYCRMGDTVRSITAALSVTKNAGTSWCNAGSAELATKEIDYFVYLGYNATDGVVVGFSRIPYATLYSDFSATSTNEKYAGISTITNAAAGDNYVNIGRFAATLSAGAGYTWTVPTFTNKNLIQRPIHETRWLSFQPAYSCSGSMTISSVVTISAIYKVIGDELFFNVSYYGTTGGTASTVIYNSLPFRSAIASGGTNYVFVGQARDGGGYLSGISADDNNTAGITKASGLRYDAANFGLGTVRGNIVGGFYPLV